MDIQRDSMTAYPIVAEEPDLTGAPVSALWRGGSGD